MPDVTSQGPSDHRITGSKAAAFPFVLAVPRPPPPTYTLLPPHTHTLMAASSQLPPCRRIVDKEPSRLIPQSEFLGTVTGGS